MTPSEIKAMPRRAIFVWPAAGYSNGRMAVSEAGRTDIEVVTPAWLRAQRFRGRHITGISAQSLEHLTLDEIEQMRMARTRINPRKAKREALSMLMARLHLTVIDVADMTSRSASTVYAWLNGQNEMPDAADRLLEHEIINRATR